MFPTAAGLRDRASGGRAGLGAVPAPPRPPRHRRSIRRERRRPTRKPSTHLIARSRDHRARLSRFAKRYRRGSCLSPRRCLRSEKPSCRSLKCRPNCRPRRCRNRPTIQMQAPRPRRLWTSAGGPRAPASGRCPTPMRTGETDPRPASRKSRSAASRNSTARPSTIPACRTRPRVHAGTHRKLLSDVVGRVLT